jgi:hypothetical protein
MPLRKKIKEKAKAVVGKIRGGQKLSLAAEVGVVFGDTPGSAGAEETEVCLSIIRNKPELIDVSPNVGADRCRRRRSERSAFCGDPCQRHSRGVAWSHRLCHGRISRYR